MKKDAIFFYKVGRINEAIFGSHHFQGDDLCHFYYRLGCLSERYTNSPTKVRLLAELFREFGYYDHLPNLADIALTHKYSHRLMKKIFHEIGYNIPARPEYSGFHAWRVRKF